MMKTKGKIYRKLAAILKEFEDTGNPWKVTDQVQRLIAEIDEIKGLKAEIKILKDELDRIHAENAELRYMTRQQLNDFVRVKEELASKSAAIAYWAQEWKESKETNNE